MFTRGPDGFSLTAAGSQILPIAQEIAARIDTIERLISGQDAKVEGVVRLTTSEALSGYLVRQLAALRERHPELSVEILSGNQAFDLLRGEADLAVRAREVTEPELVARKVAMAGWALYATSGYVERKGAPSSPEDLRGHDVISFAKDLSAVPGAQWLDAHDAGTQVVLRANSIVAAFNAAVFGMGLTVLPCFMADPEPALRRLATRVLGARDVFLVVHPDLARVAKVRAVMDFAVETFARDALLWSGQNPERAAGR